MVPEILPCEHIRNMYLDNRGADRYDGITKGYRGMRIGAGVKYDPIGREADFMQAVDKFTFHVALIVVKADIWKQGCKGFQIGIEIRVAIHRCFAGTQQIQVWTVNNIYTHMAKVMPSAEYLRTDAILVTLFQRLQGIPAP